MTYRSFLIRSLIHHWRTNLAMLIGVIAGTAVVTGALIVGDSVRASLRKMTLDRLGKIDCVMSGPRFFREELATEVQNQLESKEKTQVAPAIIMRAGVEAKAEETSHRAGQVNVYGFDERAWALIETGTIGRPEGKSIVLNSQLAEHLRVSVGDTVTIWIELPSAVPRDTLLGRKDNDSQEIQLTVSAIAPPQSGLSQLGLNPTQALPLNAFLDLHVLQERLGLEEVKPSKRDPIAKPARVNALLAHDDVNAGPNSRNSSPTASLDGAVRTALQLADLNLRIIDDKTLNCLVVESEQMILEDKLAEAVRLAAKRHQQTTSEVMVYLANKLWNPKLHSSGKEPGYSMYSTVAGLDLLELDGTPFQGFEFIGDRPQSLAENEVILNEWLAADLQVKAGDEIKFAYHLVGSRGELPEEERCVIVRGIVKMTGAAIDRALTPEVKGITDVDSLANWDQPFEMHLDAVTSRDDEYWEKYRATPKMFLPLKVAQKLWPSRYGTLTSIRVASEEMNSVTTAQASLAKSILSHVSPLDLGLAFQPVKLIGLMAANGSTDFSGLFFGFSLFLIVAAMILIGLLFRLGIEQRVRDLGLLGAIGFTPSQVRRLMLCEGLFVVVVGGLIGLFAAVGYAQLMIYGLTHWWVGAIGTKNLILSIGWISLAAGFAIAVAAAMISIWWALRQLNGLSLREQLAGVLEKEVDSGSLAKRLHASKRRATVCAGVVLVLTLGILSGLIPATGAFFGVGILSLIASISFLSAWIGQAPVQSSSSALSSRPSALSGHGTAALARLGLRNASRQQQRTVMTAGMIATATFMIVTVAAMRRDPTGELPDKKSGNGGYTLVAETSSPVLYDLNTAEGRKKLQLKVTANSPSAEALAAMNVVPFRVKPGEDASCLNLYQTRIPTILGVPQSLIDEGRFAFVSGSWNALKETGSASNGSKTGPTIPVLGDMNTLMFSMHKGVGQTIQIPNDEHPQHTLKVAGMFQDSVFQGVLVMSEENFLKLYPEQKGFRYFLIEVPPRLAEATSSLLETELAEYGFDAEPVAERLARFLSVQNTYLSTFQTLGGLGLLLGTFGLATIMLRNVLERQAELALLRAIGFKSSAIATLVLFENAFVLSWGLLAGTISALLAVAPNLTGRGGDVPLGSIFTLLAIVFATGMLAAAFAVRTAIRLPIVATLRGE